MIEILNRLLPVYDDVNCLVCFLILFFLILYEVTIVLFVVVLFTLFWCIF